MRRALNLDWQNGYAFNTRFRMGERDAQEGAGEAKRGGGGGRLFDYERNASGLGNSLSMQASSSETSKGFVIRSSAP